MAIDVTKRGYIASLKDRDHGQSLDCEAGEAYRSVASSSFLCRGAILSSLLLQMDRSASPDDVASSHFCPVL